jgi:hypothetical protein
VSEAFLDSRGTCSPASLCAGPAVVGMSNDSDAACDEASSRWARFALRAGLVLGIALAAGALLVLLGAHRADAETKADAGGHSSQGVGGAPDGAHGKTHGTDTSVVTPARTSAVAVTQPANGAASGVTEPVSQTVAPVLQQIGGAPGGLTMPGSPTLAPVVQQITPRQPTLPPPLAAFVNLTPRGQPAPLAVSPVGTVPLASPGSVALLSPTGSSPSALGSTNVAGRGRPSASGLSDSSNNRSEAPWSPWPTGAPVLPPTAPSGGGGHAPNDLLAKLPVSILTLGLLALMILLLALWSAGRPAPRPEVSPA